MRLVFIRDAQILPYLSYFSSLIPRSDPFLRGDFQLTSYLPLHRSKTIGISVDEHLVMPTTPMSRLLFAQGGDCFFCKAPLPKNEASVEHLFATANGGPDNDANCVACCKALNTLLGSMSLKEKLHVVLNQKGKFVCPNGNRSKPTPTPPAKPAENIQRPNPAG
jgi:hypothetical protein